LDPTDPLGAGFDGEVARSARRDVLLLAALLHDMAKGRGGDHSVVGVEVARAVAARIGLDPAGTDELAGPSAITCCSPKLRRDATWVTPARSAASRRRSATPSTTRSCTRSRSATRVPPAPRRG